MIALIGALGVGKTTLVKGIGKAFRVQEVITSPTYTIVSVYTGKWELYHIDLYRVASEEELFDLGIEELISGNGVFVIEWGEKALRILPAHTIRITVNLAEDTSRLIQVENLRKYH